MSVFNSVSGALAGFMVVLMIIGLGMGLLLNNTDLANFIRNTAVAEQQHVANQYQAAQNEVDIQYYRVERQQQAIENMRQISAESQVKIAQQEEALRVERENNTLRLQRDALWTDATLKTLMAFGIGLSVAISMGITFVLYRMTQLLPAGPAPMRTRTVTASAPSTIDLEPWHDPIHRAWRMAQARSRELKDIEEKIAEQTSAARERAAARRSNGYHKVTIR